MISEVFSNLNDSVIQFPLGQRQAEVLHQGCPYMKHHPSRSCCKSIQKKNKKRNGSLFFITIIIIIIIVSHFQAQKQDHWLCSNEIRLSAEASSEKVLPWPRTQTRQKVLSKEPKAFHNRDNSAALGAVSLAVVATAPHFAEKSVFDQNPQPSHSEEPVNPRPCPASQLPGVGSSYFHSFHIFTTPDSRREAANNRAGSGSFSLKMESFAFPPSSRPLPSTKCLTQAL